MSAKTLLKEVLEDRGLHLKEDCSFTVVEDGMGGWRAHVTVTLPTGEVLTGSGGGRRWSHAEVQASADLMARHPDFRALGVADKRDALAGDALIKLATYLEDPARDPASTSGRLGRIECDTNLAAVYDGWARDRDEATRPYGCHLGVERKAMIVEATLWRRFGSQMLGPGSASSLSEVLGILTLAAATSG